MTPTQVAFALATLLAAPAAHAQNVLMMNGTGNGPVLRINAGERAQTISINFQLSMPATSATSSSDLTKAMAAASQSLYDIVDRECDILTVALKGGCRLVQMNVGGNINNRGINGQPVVSANANAVFEIAPPPLVPAEPSTSK